MALIESPGRGTAGTSGRRKGPPFVPPYTPSSPSPTASLYAKREGTRAHARTGVTLHAFGCNVFLQRERPCGSLLSRAFPPPSRHPANCRVCVCPALLPSSTFPLSPPVVLSARLRPLSLTEDSLSFLSLILYSLSFIFPMVRLGLGYRQTRASRMA